MKPFFEKFNFLLFNLNTAQMGAGAHILLAIAIYYATINIVMTYYGDL